MTVQEMPWPPTLLMPLHWATGAAAALAGEAGPVAMAAAKAADAITHTTAAANHLRVRTEANRREMGRGAANEERDALSIKPRLSYRTPVLGRSLWALPHCATLSGDRAARTRWGVFVYASIVARLVMNTNTKCIAKSAAN